MTRDGSNSAGRFRPLRCLLLAWLLAGVGCGQVRFYSQAVSGQCGLWARQRSADALLRDPSTSPELRERLLLAGQIRTFARDELGLEPGRSYQRYADLRRDFVSWTVTAAPEFSLEPKEWWYPIVGRLGYRGYFRRDLAEKVAGQLHAEGWDVSVGGVTAYSTLGWFADPLLNTFLFAPEDELADLLFHELAHRRLFVPGDTDFNEAFATAVAEEGLDRWLRHTGDTALAGTVARRRERDGALRDILLAGRQRLDTLYRVGGPEDELRAGKKREFDRIHEELAALARSLDDDPVVAAWARAPLNNARLNDVATYHALVPAFRRLLEESGGDLPAWYARVEALGRLPEVERAAALVPPPLLGQTE